MPRYFYGMKCSPSGDKAMIYGSKDTTQKQDIAFLYDTQTKEKLGG